MPDAVSGFGAMLAVQRPASPRYYQCTEVIRDLSGALMVPTPSINGQTPALAAPMVLLMAARATRC